MTLALRLGKTLRQLLEEIDAHELGEWQAYDRLQPIDETKRIETALGIISSLTYNPNRPEHVQAKSAKDFIVDYAAFWKEFFADPPTDDEVERKRKELSAKLDSVFGSFGSFK